MTRQHHSGLRLRVLFDGECGLCSRSVRFLFAREKTATFVFTPIQSEAGRVLAGAAGIEADDPSSFVFFDSGGKPRFKSDAAFEALRYCSAPWPTIAICCRLLPRALSDWVYDYVAKRRLKFFGREDACATAPEALKRRLETTL